MASRSAGTLITHNNATFIPPALMPGYHGHVPTAMFSYGDTYGNTTFKHFQDFRSAAMTTSQTPYNSGGQFPTFYSNDPELVIANRSRNRDKWLYSPSWSRYNADYKRTMELQQFNKIAQQQREHYKDKTGTGQGVNYFVLPECQNPRNLQHIRYPSSNDMALTFIQ
ncbi:protein FAM166C [Protopterus annectens]|uniref:protein FAM166C n=1 Tax=Protopterus annectens TaxID=7888 RepID=UPI001CFAFAD4|nr:protein FAM166C [Protopterus annectens]